jgi:RHS repeat-associated protein
MRSEKLLALVAAVICFFVFQTPASAQYSNGYSGRRSVVIDHTKVPNTDQSNFPMLFSGTYTYLATTANGGGVTNSNGYDIIFTSDANGSSVLPFERESYNATTGAVIFWVQIPTVSHTSDTMIYLFYGNSSVTTDQANKTAVWDSNYKGIWHFPNGSTLSGADSSSDGYTLTNNNGTSATTGKIDGGASFNGSGNYLSNSSLSIPSGSSITISFWNYVTSSNVQNSAAFTIGNSTDPNRISAHAPWSDNVLYWDYGTYNGGGRVSTNYSSYLGSWTYVVLEYNATSTIHSIYLNATLAVSNTNANVPQATQSGIDIGFWPLYSIYQRGSMDEFRVSTIARSADWVAAEYNNQSSPSTFYNEGSPVITTLSPSVGYYGTSVTITGTNFGPAQGSSTVKFGGVSANITSWSNTSIVATVPAGASSGNVVVTVSGIASLGVNFTIFPTGWSYQDVGSVGLAGNASYSGSSGTFTVNGTGNTNSEIAGTADSFSFAYQPLSGDGTIVTRIVSLGSAYAAQAGVMIRESLNANATMMFFGYKNTNSEAQVYRSTTGGNTTQGGVANSPLPYWFKLTRSGSSFNAYLSVDGVNWTWEAGQTISMATNAYVGLAVSSDSGGSLVTAVFDDVSISPASTPAPQISGVSSDNGSVGTQIAISGSGFGSSQGYSAVFLGDVSAPIGSWSDTSIVIQVPTGASSGYLVVAVAPSMNDSNPVDFTVTSNPLPSPWFTQDIGGVAVMGNASYASSTGTFTINGGGNYNSGIRSDTFYFVYQPLSGNGTVIAHLANLQGSNPNYMEAGLMVRETVNSGATMAYGGYQGGGDPFYWRTTTGGTVSAQGGPNVSLPYWFMLIRSGNTFTFYTAPDGVNWTQINSTTITMATNVYIGMAVSSFTSSDLATATFDHVAISNSTSPPSPVISSLTPSSAPIGGKLTIAGTSLGSSQSSSMVQFNNITASVISWSSTSINVTVPNNATSGPVTVTVGGIVSNGVQFTLIESLSITSISPTSGPVGATLTINGTGFGPSQSNSIVAMYGGNITNITSWTDTSIVGVVPSGSATGPVAVTVAGNNVQGPYFTITTGANITDSLGNTSSYQGQMVGGQWRMTNSQGSGCSTCTVRGVISATYDGHGNKLSNTDPMNNTTTYSYDNSNDLLSQTSPVDSTHNATTSYTYNNLGEVLTATDALGNVTTNTYDSHGNLTSVTTPAPNGNTAASVTQFVYNSLGELTTVTDPLNHVTTMTYTPAGLIATITDAQNHVTTYGYDAHGNRTSVKDANNQTTTFAYDAGDRLKTIVYPDNSTTTFNYDIRGRKTSATDQNGKITTYTYDDADRLISVTDAANHTTTYAYDTEDNLLRLTDGNTHSTFFSYDAFSRVTNANYPSSQSETYAYDANDNVTSKTDRKGQTIVYVYDDLNRLTSKNYPDTTSVVYAYDLMGKVLQVTDPTGSYAFSYDNMGRQTGATTSYSFLTGRNFSASYAYDSGSNRTSFTDPEGGTTAYSYDTLNRLTTLAPPTAFGSGSFGFGYDVLSRRTQMTRPNNVTTNYTYDNLSRLLSVLHQVGSSIIDGASYNIDNAGNRTSKTDWLANVSSNYTYDQIYELTQVTQGNNATESYSYDPVGNRTSSLGVSPYNYNNSNELTSTPNASYTYDNNGNITTKADSTGTTAYSWDFENRLTSVTLPGNQGTVSFKYDPFGRRIYKSSPISTSIFVYEGDNLVEETNSSGATVARYTQTQNVDEPLAMLRGSATSYYEADGLGSITSLTTPAGALAQTYTFDSFGNQTGASGSLTNSLHYTARDFDVETNLYYYRARYYEAQSGRFLSEDPIKFQGGINLYAYTTNNAVNFDDPAGLYVIENRITQHFTSGWAIHCPPNTAGACTVDVASALLCPCTQEGDCPPYWKAHATFRVYGNMWIYNGPWSTLPRQPRDRNVHDAASAVAHENGVHINPAIDAVKPLLSWLESQSFGSAGDCQAACVAAQNTAPQIFGNMLRTTQQQEQSGR